jgi:hypothetical protein
MPLAIPSGTLLTALFNPASMSRRSALPLGTARSWFATASRSAESPGWSTSGASSRSFATAQPDDLAIVSSVYTSVYVASSGMSGMVRSHARYASRRSAKTCGSRYRMFARSRASRERS